MARPRKYVNASGKPVKVDTGVSYNTARHRFYIIRSDGTRQEYQTWDQARAALVTERANSIPAEELARMEAVARYRDDLARLRLITDPEWRARFDGMMFAGPVVLRGRTHAEAVVSFAESANAWADHVGVPRMKLEKDAAALPGGPRMRDVIERWKKHMVERKGEQSPHHRAVERLWDEFVKQVGNVFVAELSPEHFRRFHSWVAREGKKRSSSQWEHDRVSRVKSVITFVRRKYPEWPWPVGVLEWANGYDVKPFRPKASNREPFPPEAFAALIQQCRIWASIDPKTQEAGTQSGRAKREQARRKRRDGVQFEAVLRLGINCGLDPIDIERLTSDDLNLDAKVPHLRFARRKAEGKVGGAVERMTPLLPSTVDALRRWKAYEYSLPGPVFRTANKGRYYRNRISHTLERLRRDAHVDDRWSFKHLRNVGPTLGKRAKLSKDEREAFLGHVVNGGSSIFYEADVDETYLIALVNLIGEKYLGGEVVDTGQEGSPDSAEAPSS